jgi:flagellin-specific chaperone FliS
MLDRLYGHVLGRLMLINHQNDAAICEELAALLRRMRAGWAELADQPAAAPAMVPATAATPAALTA